MDSAPRIIREIKTLEPNFELVLIGNSNQADNSYIHPIYSFRSFYDKVRSRVDRISKKKKLRYSKLIPFILQKKIQLLIIHEPMFFPLAIHLKEKYGLKIIFNAHEYHPLEFEDIPKWLSTEGAYFSHLYQQDLHQFDLFINVCESIRLKCLKEFNIDSIVIPNATFESKISPSINGQFPIRLIHHGALLPGRKIEKMISIVQEAGENFTLDIMGVPNAHAMDYYYLLENLCSKTNNVRLINPVKFNEIVPFINQYDIGIYLLEPSNFNNFNALPNKLYEFIQAKLAIIVSPTPEMSNLVSAYQIGKVAEDFSTNSMVEILKKITPKDIAFYKENAEKAARIENAENYQKIFLEQILSLTKEY
jgi:glycosyltransferase involved in cell wall biosynthesis